MTARSHQEGGEAVTPHRIFADTPRAASPAAAPSPEQASVPAQSDESAAGDVFTLTRLDVLVVGLLGALVALGTLAVLAVGALVVGGMVGR